MSTALDLVYQYRQLAGKCETRGLSMEEIVLMQTIEAFFAKNESEPTLRRFAREPVELTAVLRARGHRDSVRIDNLAPGGLVALHAPYFEDGDVVEVVVDDAECSLSYRFKAVVTWLHDEPEGDFTLGLCFVGTPLLLRYSTGAAQPAQVVDAAA